MNFGPPPPVDHLTDVPDLENQRQAQLSAVPATPTVLDAHFDCAAAPMATKISDTEFSLDYQHKDDDGGPDGVYWFMFKLKGVAGKAVRIDLKGIPLDKWHTLNPVYQYADGAVPAISEPLLPDDYNLRSAKTVDGHNGTRMPDTSGEPGGWHFIQDVWATGGSTLSFVHTFDKNDATVAMRTPFTLEDEEALMAQATQDKAPPDMAAQVIDIGKTPEGRTLHVVKLSSGGEQGEKGHPCILMYAREHADEHDSSWLVAGALRWLLADNEKAQDLRSKFTFMFIPILDVDLAAKSGHAHVITSFLPNAVTPESIAYAGFFEKWMQKGNPADIVFNFHNMESAEGENLVPPIFPPKDSPWSAPTIALHREIRAEEQSEGFSVHQDSWTTQFSPERLGGWLAGVYGALHLPYEANSQNPQRHVLATEISRAGSVMLQAGCAFLTSDASRASRKLSADGRGAYEERWGKYGTQLRQGDVIAMESQIRELEQSRALLDAVLQK